jgi:misacylated tRNA(Ala) deacylase|tara:strand:- start:2947 stop:3618 length:672 start_codon:yes stop_codon:yes gene_type:complete
VVDSQVIDGDYWVQFDKTYYYPSGGGQPADHGTISADGIKYSILDVKKRSEILHLLSDSVNVDSLVNQTLTAEIDQQRRDILCRMHTAQHLVSAAADELFSATTIGNQINTQKTRIDIGIESRDSFSKDDLESSVNNYIDSAVDVSMSFRPRDELIEDPLVRVNMDLIPKNIHELRVITIDGIDICPCAGTHVGNTNQIGYIEIGKVKSKGAGKLRVEYTLVD